MSTHPLPVDPYLQDIAEAFSGCPSILVGASAGTGKTTRIPPALLPVCNGTILVLEPRRIAARLAARRVAWELGELCGNRVGYQIRFEDCSGKETRLKYITEGLLLKYMLSNPRLDGVSCVVLDEFHERSIHTDVAFAMLRFLQETSRPDLKLLIMSATLDLEQLQSRVPELKSFSIEGKMYPLEIRFLPQPEKKPLHFLVSRAVSSLYDEPRCRGHILVFLPGAAEIRAAKGALLDFAGKGGALLLELRSELPYEQQAMALEPSGKRKIILATNVAETSVTIEGVTAVVDSGLARIAGFAHWSGMTTLDVRNVSQASCIQRAGRAGRTSAGVVERLYTRSDFTHRPPFETPEIMRSELAAVFLELTMVLRGRGPGKGRIEDLPWLEKPPQAMMDKAQELLRVLGAVDGSGEITGPGRRMASIPLHPRLGRMVAEGESLGRAPQALLLASIISEGMIVRRGVEAPDVGESDVDYQRELFVALQQGKKIRPSLQIDAGKKQRVEALVRTLSASLGFSCDDALKPLSSDEAAQIVFAGFPDRVAAVRGLRHGFRGSGEISLNLCTGGGGTLSRASVVRDSPWLIAVEAEEKTLGTHASQAVQVRVAAAVSPELLVLSENDFVRQEESCHWDEKEERVRGASRITYGKLVLEEREPALDPHCCEDVLFSALKRQWPAPFGDARQLAEYSRRADLLRSCGIGVMLPDLAHGEFEMLLRSIARGHRDFAEIRKKDLRHYIEQMLSPEARHALRAQAPLSIQIGCNRSAAVRYEEGQAPWVASRLQDFFGTPETPRICSGKVPLVAHLLAPNGRAVQVTNDLGSFWKNIYPAVKKELSRRYPRHYWPDNPLEASPRLPGRRRR